MFAVSTALRKRIGETCRRDLSKAFLCWLIDAPEQRAELISLAAKAADRDGAEQDFQTVALLGFAADRGPLSESQMSALKRGLGRLAGRSAFVNGVPMAFCADAVGILGVALGANAAADPILVGQVVRWATGFLRTSYERAGPEDWRRCLFACADLKLHSNLQLQMPKSPETADVRIAMYARGLMEVEDGKQAEEDAAYTLKLRLAVRHCSDEFGCERLALRPTALQWVRPTRSHAKGRNVRVARKNAVDHRWDWSQARKTRNPKNPVRRNATYEAIHSALRVIAEARPNNHEAVFRLLDSRKIPLPNRKPFKAAGGWLKGYLRDPYMARAWLSYEWGRLNLPPFVPGPKNNYENYFL